MYIQNIVRTPSLRYKFQILVPTEFLIALWAVFSEALGILRSQSVTVYVVKVNKNKNTCSSIVKISK